MVLAAMSLGPNKAPDAEDQFPPGDQIAR